MANTIMQLAIIEAAVVPFPGVDAVLKGKGKDSGTQAKVCAVQKLLGLKEGTKKDKTEWSSTAQAVFDWKLEHPGERVPDRNTFEREKVKVKAEADGSVASSLAGPATKKPRLADDVKYSAEEVYKMVMKAVKSHVHLPEKEGESFEELVHRALTSAKCSSSSVQESGAPAVAKAAEPLQEASSDQKIDGIIEFDFGVYRGEVKDGKPDGHGTLIYTDADALDAADAYDIDCKIEDLRLGSMYVGQFKNGKMNGHGVQTNDFDAGYQKDHIYVGQWKDDMMHGKGSLIMPKGGTTDVDLHGKRRMAYMIEGQWENHTIKGTTKKRYADGRAKTRKEEDCEFFDDPDDVESS